MEKLVRSDFEKIYVLDPETVALSGADYIGNDVPYDLRPVNQGPGQSQFGGVPLTTSVGYNPNQPPQSYNPSQSYAGPQNFGGNQGLVQSGFIQPNYSQGLPNRQGGF